MPGHVLVNLPGLSRFAATSPKQRLALVASKLLRLACFPRWAELVVFAVICLVSSQWEFTLPVVEFVTVNVVDDVESRRCDLRHDVSVKIAASELGVW